MSVLVSKFTMVDKYGLSTQEILDEAFNAANRRGDLEGYEAHKVELGFDMPIEHNGAMHWQINVYGEFYPGFD